MSEDPSRPVCKRRGPLIHGRKRRAADALADGPNLLARDNRVARNINVAGGVGGNGGGSGKSTHGAHCETIHRRPGHATVGALADEPPVRLNAVDLAEHFRDIKFAGSIGGDTSTEVGVPPQAGVIENVPPGAPAVAARKDDSMPVAVYITGSTRGVDRP